MSVGVQDRTLAGIENSKHWKLHKAKAVAVIVYEPILDQKEFFNSEALDELCEFKSALM